MRRDAQVEEITVLTVFAIKMKWVERIFSTFEYLSDEKAPRERGI